MHNYEINYLKQITRICADTIQNVYLTVSLTYPCYILALATCYYHNISYWDEQVNTYYEPRLQVGVGLTPDQCKAACVNSTGDTSCYGVNFHPPTGGCALVTAAVDTLTDSISRQDVLHYRREVVCPGKILVH